MINTENLQVGQVVKNYKELCSLMDLEPTTGNAKIAQMKEIDRYIDYEKSGQKFLITEIFEFPIPKEERLAANAKYVQLIQPLLLSYLAAQPEEVIYISKIDLWEQLGMVNDQYRFGNSNRDEIVKNLPITMFTVNNFFLTSASRITRILEPSLKSLERRSVLQYNNVFMISWEEQNWDTPIIQQREATEEEISYILNIRNRTLAELGFETETEVYLKNQSRKYYEELNRIFNEERGWKSVYKCIKINFSKEAAIRVAEKNSIKLQLNDIVVNTLIQDAEKRYTKNMDNSNGRFQLPALYPMEYTFLTHKYAKIDKI